jgi:transcription antitermination factor NusG
MQTTFSGWFALQLFSNREFKVLAELTRLGIEAFLPTIHEEHRWSDRTRTIERPVFPGYVFIRVERANLQIAARVSGVCRILGQGLEPEQIPDDQIEDVRRVLTDRARTATPSPYVAGQSVEVRIGGAVVRGVVQRLEGRTQLVVGVELLRRAVAVTLDAADVESAA